MKTQFLGSSGIEVSCLAYGCMRISGTWDRSKVDAAAIQRGIEALEAAVESGCTESRWRRAAKGCPDRHR